MILLTEEVAGAVPVFTGASWEVLRAPEAQSGREEGSDGLEAADGKLEELVVSAASEEGQAHGKQVGGEFQSGQLLEDSKLEVSRRPGR